ncbi:MULTISPECIES: hypothetical protein [Arthrobacter]|uniref:DUF2530 domain-containing protein n=2 Tax=Arthrobacter TaxID=1663 RepID=A0ABU9KIZ5_9MICC|nr:hypothetical protein [Arthrobacter sp. YJM1]MDP5226433.1 hypothetical protein [Arthrobacter sp. YJM1]
MTRPRGAEEGMQEPLPGPRLMRSAQDLDVLIGMLGFWTLVLFIATVWTELSGGAALGWALGLLAAVAGMWGLFRLRRRLPSRTIGHRNGR